MTENEKHLVEARARIASFETESEPERLREASMSLANVSLKIELDARKRAGTRGETLRLWLELLRILDEFVDPSFNPNDVPPKTVMPPRTSSGILYPPGASPSLIDNPIARAEYEKAIQDNRERQNRYRMQTHLHRLNESIPPRAEAFIRKAYSSSPEDQTEVKGAVEKTITNPARRESLLKLVGPLES